jgi:PAS domain S-box-containing protein
MSDDGPTARMRRTRPPATKREPLDLADHLFHRDALALAEQSAGIGVWSIDLTTGLARGTAQFFRIMGLPPTSGEVPLETIRALRHPDDRARVLAGFRQALEDGTDTYEIEYRILHPERGMRWIFGRGRVVRDEHGTPVRYSGIDIDITDRKAAEAELAAAKEALERLNEALEARVRERTAALEAEAERRAQAEARLHQAQKMEAVGQLTGGLAHDFNNILQVIVGNLQIASRLVERGVGVGGDGPPREQLQAAIATAQRASRSARDLVLRMLAFSRLQNLEPAVVDVNALIAGMRDMIARTLGETIEVDVRCAPDLWPTFADRNQLETALLNLVVNARDAMPGGGSVTIQTGNVEIGAGDADEIPPGSYVVLSVADTGCGIAADVLPRVFEPFFTTKETGRGSGLGLSMVYGFVSQSGGHVRIASREGAGTRVRIYLPRATETAPAAAAAGGDAGDASAMPRARSGETVLLVEDNEDVRRLGVDALEQLGYRVVQAPDGRSALRTLDEKDARIDLLFTDVVLPGGMTGYELARAAKARRARLPTLFTSGYAAGKAGAAGGVDADVPLLSKPYGIEALARAIRRAIDARAGADTS